MSDKPHKGRISQWGISSNYANSGFFIYGTFLDHPEFRGEAGYTSQIVKYDRITGEIETDNSRYTLVKDDKPA